MKKNILHCVRRLIKHFTLEFHIYVRGEHEVNDTKVKSRASDTTHSFLSTFPMLPAYSAHRTVSQ